MDAIIFNSGLGNRIANLIKDSHKSLLNIHGESILVRQLRILASYDINRVVITTGPNAEKLHQEVKNKNYPFEIVFVHSQEFAKTNYIYSMNLASKFLNNDTLMMHGDLVFNSKAIQKLLNIEGDCVLIDNELEAYKKDFKAIQSEGYIRKISTKLNEYDYGLQPVYKLSKATILKWKNKVQEYVDNGKVLVYAEDALNELLSTHIDLQGVLIGEDYCKEIDDELDYSNVLNEINEYDNQQTIIEGSLIENIKTVIFDKKVLFITSSRLKDKITDWFRFHLKKEILLHDEKNTEKDSITQKTYIIDEFNPDFVVSIGGGTIIDFTKCLIDFSNTIAKHIAVPTTCGTGSESTKFAVYYKDGIKHSLKKNKILPEIAILDNKQLLDLPQSVLISSVLDAFCQSIESFWSKKSTKKSKEYSIKAIKIIYPILLEGLNNYSTTLKKLQKASNLAGKAINITTTTAPHALSYNLTQLYKIPHGIAVSMTLPIIWQLHTEKVIGFENYIEPIVIATKSKNNKNLLLEIKTIFKNLNIWKKYEVSDRDIDYLVENVNFERLSNNPYILDKEEILMIYKKALLI